jgi:hypothetical protein
MLHAQTSAARITERIDPAHLTTLHSGVHPLARPEFDRGEISGGTRAERMLLVLARSPAQEGALRTLLESQQDASSPQFHQWLTPSAFGANFGPSDADLAVLTAWLTAQGFGAIQVNAGRTVVEFSGSAAQLNSAFHVSLHNYVVHGVSYTANSAEPQIPSALAPVVAGFASLNNFPRRAHNAPVGTVRRDKRTGAISPLSGLGLLKAPAAAPASVAHAPSTSTPSPDFTFSESNTTLYGIVPYDFATIYNVLPLWTAATPTDGTGQVIAISGRTDINPVDFVNFRRIFGLPVGAASSATGSSYLNIIYNGPNPGINSDEAEADIDTQWAGAVAKGATIDFVTSADSITTYGIDLSEQYIVDNNLAPVMSTSYGACEQDLGPAGNLEYLQLWEQASAQGITALVSSGDSGNAGCDQSSATPAVVGTAVSGFQSTPFNVSVGGTDFNIAQGGAAYFSSANSVSTEASALGYIPEVPWNTSCTNFQIPLFSPWIGLNAEQVCNTSSAVNDGLSAVGGASGGPSSCTTTDSNGNCTGGYPKPSWQTGPGVPADGVRDTPDVSLFASNGTWNAFYLVCEDDASLSGTCDVNAPYEDFQGFGGTSIATPAFAGILAMVNQKMGARQGNANYVLYRLFNSQIVAATPCNSNSSPSSSCVFHDIAVGTITQPCYSVATNCTFTSANDRIGTLSGGAATAGYDTATGLGSVNATNLVNNWSTAVLTATTTTLTLNPTTLVHGAALAASVSVRSASGTPTGDVSILGATANGASTYGTLSSGVFSATLDRPLPGAQSGLNSNTLPGGSYNVTAHYGGSSVYAQSDSAPIAVTITPEKSTLSITPSLVNFSNGAVTPVTGGSAPYGTPNYISFKVAGVSGQGFATGTLTVSDTAGAYDGGAALKLTSLGGVDDESVSLSPGTHTLTAAYSGDASFNASTATSPTFTITKAATTSTVYVASSNGTTSGTVTLEIILDTTSFGYFAPTGSVTLTSGGKTLGSATLVQGFSTFTDYNESFGELVVPASMLSTGSNIVVATYAGDTNYGGSSGQSTVALNAGTLTATTTTLTVNPTTYTNGGNLAFTAAVTPSSPAPTGSVTLYIDGTNYGAFALSSGTFRGGGVPSALPSGANTVYVVYSGDTRYASSTSNVVTLTVTQQGFTLVGPQAPATVSAPGATSTASTLTTIPVTGLSGNLNVSFACTSGLPSLAACIFSPSTVSIGPASATTSLTITTAAPVAGATPLRFPWQKPGSISLAALGLLLLPRLRRKRFGALLGAILAFAALATLSGCGGNTFTPTGIGGHTAPSSPGTPTGTYAVVVTGTSGTGATAVSATTTVTLVVN